ncbi:hypothetical protein SDC9_205631 [bioreactor metagenome]|uniref:Uncharacterized protein n=1 Tax=bioreactor metagenome TaxID=1076179 RepID=A0A645J2L4_9ZZZZ
MINTNITAIPEINLIGFGFMQELTTRNSPRTMKKIIIAMKTGADMSHLYRAPSVNIKIYTSTGMAKETRLRGIVFTKYIQRLNVLLWETHSVQYRNICPMARAAGISMGKRYLVFFSGIRESVITTITIHSKAKVYSLGFETNFLQ